MWHNLPESTFKPESTQIHCNPLQELFSDNIFGDKINKHFFIIWFPTKQNSSKHASWLCSQIYRAVEIHAQHRKKDPVRLIIKCKCYWVCSDVHCWTLWINMCLEKKRLGTCTGQIYEKYYFKKMKSIYSNKTGMEKSASLWTWLDSGK